MNKPKIERGHGGGGGGSRKEPPTPPVNLPPTVVHADRPRDPPHPAPPRPAPAPAPAPPFVNHTGPAPGMGSTPTSRMTPYQLGAYKYTTPGGHRYSVQMRLTTGQEKVVAQIVDYGFSQSAPEETMAIVAATAFQESTFGERRTTETSSALGLFQFTAPTWNEKYAHLDRNSDTDQISVMFLRTTEQRHRYVIDLSTGRIPGTMRFSEYAYSNHKQGPSHPERFATNSETVEDVRKFMDKLTILALHVE